MRKLVLIIFFFSGSLIVTAQNSKSTSDEQKVVAKKSNIVERPMNAIIGSVGTSVANGDLPEPKFDLNFQIGYKRSIAAGFNVNLTYNKFNIVFKDVYNEGFMSIDLDLEYLFFKDKKFTPFLYAGPGVLAANGFENAEFKFQLGLGIEYLVSESVGLRFYADRNFLSSDDTIDGLKAGAGSDAFYKIGIGANFYFPRNVRKVKDGEPSFIKDNKLDDF